MVADRALRWGSPWINPSISLCGYLEKISPMEARSRVRSLLSKLCGIEIGESIEKNLVRVSWSRLKRNSEATTPDRHTHSHEEAHGDSRAEHSHWYDWESLVLDGVHCTNDSSKSSTDHAAHLCSLNEQCCNLSSWSEDSLELPLHASGRSLV